MLSGQPKQAEQPGRGYTVTENMTDDAVQPVPFPAST